MLAFDGGFLWNVPVKALKRYLAERAAGHEITLASFGGYVVSNESFINLSACVDAYEAKRLLNKLEQRRD